MTQEELEFVYRWVWVNEWHQPLKDFEETPYEYILDLFQARRWDHDRQKKQNKGKGNKPSKLEQMEANVLRDVNKLAE